MQLLFPVLGVEFVDDAVERTLLRQGCVEVDLYEVDAVLFGIMEE